MTPIRIKIADCTFEINNDLFDDRLFCSFLSKDPALFSIDTTYRRRIMTEKNESIGWEINTSAVHFFKRLYEVLLNYDLLLIHGAAISLADNSILFSAPSGTGKTTHILKWLDRIPNAYVVNGDKPFVKFSANITNPLVCGSPWAGKENLYTNTMVPLKSIVLMERADENHIEQISFSKAFPYLLQQVYRPNDEEKMRKTLSLMQRLLPAVSFWHFKCNNFKDDCFDVAYNALMREQK